MSSMPFRYNSFGTWRYTTEHGRYDINVMKDGRFNAWYTDIATDKIDDMSRTQVVFTLRQAIEWCERYEIMLHRKRSESHV